jgi:hypothetical protein
MLAAIQSALAAETESDTISDAALDALIKKARKAS